MTLVAVGAMLLVGASGPRLSQACGLARSRSRECRSPRARPRQPILPSMSSRWRRPASPMRPESQAFAAGGMSATARRRKVFVVGLHRSGTHPCGAPQSHPSICGHDIMKCRRSWRMRASMCKYGSTVNPPAPRPIARVLRLARYAPFATIQLLRMPSSYAPKIPSQHQSTRSFTLNRSLTHSLNRRLGPSPPRVSCQPPSADGLPAR